MITFRKGRSFAVLLTTFAYGGSGYTNRRHGLVTKTWRVMTFRAAESQRSTGKSILLAMKITAVLILGICLHAAAAGHAQRITYNAQSATLNEVLTEVKRQTGYDFIIGSGIEKSKIGPVHANELNLNDFLKKVLLPVNLDYVIEYQTIFVRLKKNAVKSPTPNLEIPPITIRGKIINEKGEPVVASITVKGTNKGAMTDNHGNFEIAGVDNNAILIVSGIGIESQSIELSGRNEISIRVVTSTNPLDEVVFKGYYAESKRLSTGNVSKITEKDISSQPILNPIQSIAGRMAGVDVVQTSGIAGSGLRIKIRGTNSLRNNANNPLYIIDGVVFLSSSLSTTSFTTPTLGESPLNGINPSDIESIEVLKDADATAIYGSRGANGVVIITTKKGKLGKTSLDVNVYGGIGQVGHKMQLLNTQQYLQMRNEAYYNVGGAPVGANARDVRFWDTTRFTDWQKELIGGNSNILNTTVSLSGGNANARYYAGGNYYKESTVFPGTSGFKRGSAYLNLQTTSENQKFHSTMSASYSATANNLPIIDYTKMSLTLPPIAPMLYTADKNLNWQLTPGGVNTWNNPLAYLKNSHQSSARTLISSANLSYQIVDGLKLKANLGYTISDFSENQKERLSFYEPLVITLAQGVTATARYSDATSQTWNVEPQLEYEKRLSFGRISALAGMTFQETSLKSESFEAGGYTSDALLENIAVAPSISNFRNNKTDYKYNAFFARLNYSYEDRYLINFTGRRDGSSRFGPDKQFSNFGAVAIGWIFTKEKWLNINPAFLSFGKFRGSYGTSGNDQIPDYGYLDSYTSSQYPYQGNSGLIPTQLANPDYAWEINKKLEFGFELGFLNDRIQFSTSYFKNRSSNQLIGYGLSGVTGFSSVQYNLPATVQNTGFEFELFSENVKRKHFSWTTSFNLTIPRNKLVSYPGIEGSPYNTTYVVGQPLSVTYKYRYTGVDPETGLYTFKDFNNDGVISFPEDITPTKFLGQQYFGGVQNRISYKNLEFSFHFQFVKQTGIDYSGSSVFTQPGVYDWITVSGNQPVEVMNRWQNKGNTTDVQLFANDFGVSSTTFYDYVLNSDGPIKDASFIRLRNLSLAWRAPERWIHKAKISTLRIYIQAQNLFTITNYIGLDPENQNPATLPPLRTVTAGIQITL